MSKKNPKYSSGDWIVHCHHGVGQIQGSVEMQISGESNLYYKVETEKSTMWIPVDKGDEEWFRPVTPRSEFQKILDILKKPPRAMASHHKRRHSRIKNVKSENSLAAIARTVRDLYARQKNKSLNNTEQRALRRLTNRLLAEWSVCMNMEQEEARQKLHTILAHSHQQAMAMD